ncbi:MAG: CHAD domain-containing protein [Gemmatimonas sp.]
MADSKNIRVDTDRLMPSVLHVSAEEGARIIALHWLNGLADSRDRMLEANRAPRRDSTPGSDTPGSDDATHLHKARVALRRLRAVLREHHDLVDIGRRLPRALKRLNEATNNARDADVQRAWLRAEGEALGNSARKQAALLLESLASRAERDRVRVAKAFATHWDSVAGELSDRLAHYSEWRIVGRPPSRHSFAGSLATRLGKGAGEIETALSQLASNADIETPLRADFSNPLAGESLERLHALRIRLKRQRALLAPFTPMHAAVGRWYELATRGQDSLGAMRDASLLADLAHEHEMAELESALRATALGHYEAFYRGWCSDADAVTRVSVSALGAVAALDAVAAADTLPLEIERKYLLRAIPPYALGVAPTQIEQGWLPGTVLKERLRRATRADGTTRLTRTVKAGTLGSRVELEEGCSTDLFELLWPHTCAARIRKHRHAVVDGDFTWEIDVFLDRELVLAEVELRDDQSVPPAPEWLAPYIVRDVTDDRSYANSSMATPDQADASAGEPAHW